MYISSTAHCVFTKTTQLVVAILQELGVNIIIYIGDILIIACRDRDRVYAEEPHRGCGLPSGIPSISHSAEFIVDSTAMELKLGGENMKEIKRETAREALSSKVDASSTAGRVLAAPHFRSQNCVGEKVLWVWLHT